MRLSSATTQLTEFSNRVELPGTCCSELLEIRSGEPNSTNRDAFGVGVGAPGVLWFELELPASTATASASGPLGSFGPCWICCELVLPQLDGDDCARGVIVMPAGGVLGDVMFVVSGKKVRSRS